MTKFKVGDRVVVVKDLITGGHTGFYVGQKGVVQCLNPDTELAIRVWVDGAKEKYTGFMEDELEFEDENL